MIAAMRIALAGATGLLLAAAFASRERRAAGLTLTAIGAAAALPAGLWASRRQRRPHPTRSGVWIDRRLIGVTRYPRKGDEPL